MEKLGRFLDRLFNAIEALIYLGGGVLGGFIAWWWLGLSEVAMMARLGGTALIAIVFMFVTALLWKILTIFNA